MKQHQSLNPLSWRHKFRSRPGTAHDNSQTPPSVSQSRPATAILKQTDTETSFSRVQSNHSSQQHPAGVIMERDGTSTPVGKDFAYQDSPITDSFSLLSESREPLINDSKSDIIPQSVRPSEHHKRAVDGPNIPPRRSTFSTSKSIQSSPKQDMDFVPQSPLRVLDSPRRPENNQQLGEQDYPTSSSVGSSGRASFASSDTAQSVHELPPLQVKSVLDEADRLEPVTEDDPGSFDLVGPSPANHTGFSVEKRAAEMFSHAHLKEIFADPTSMLKFTQYLSQYRPDSVPVLIYYLDAVKSLKAITYANAIAEALGPIPGLSFTDETIDKTINAALEKRAQEAFDVLVREDLPAYITHVFIQIVNVSLQRRVRGTIPSHLREASEGLAEVFCLTDPSRQDNPIIFASEEFHRTTQYGVDYCIGRNCRFLQGPSSSKESVRRLKEASTSGKEINELFVNYRRDGSPFMNLLTVAPLLDSKGNIRYNIGFQIDVSGLCKDMSDLDSLKKVVARQSENEATDDQPADEPEPKDEFQELTEMFNDEELDIVRRNGGRMNPVHGEDEASLPPPRPRIHVRDPSSESAKDALGMPIYPSLSRGRNSSLFQNYLLVRPYPSLRILFASPALRTPGILQSPFLSRIGGSKRVRDELTAALATGRGVTAKVRWLSGRAADADGAPRWVHCTPLFGKSGNVGVWMVVLVDEEGYEPIKRFKEAPPVAADSRSEAGSRVGRGNSIAKSSAGSVSLQSVRL